MFFNENDLKFVCFLWKIYYFARRLADDINKSTRRTNKYQTYLYIYLNVSEYPSTGMSAKSCQKSWFDKSQPRTTNEASGQMFLFGMTTVASGLGVFSGCANEVFKSADVTLASFNN